MNQTTAQQPEYTLMRAMACIAVITIHTTSTLVDGFDKITFTTWSAAVYIDSISRFCVPFFIMLSGALLLPRFAENNPTNIKRILKLLKTTLFWSALYMLFQHFTDATPWKSLLINLLKGSPFFHLYYLFIALGLYAISPLVASSTQRFNKKSWLWIGGIAISFSCSNYFLRLYLSIDNTTALERFLPFLGYYLLGYALSIQIIQKKKFWFYFSIFIPTIISLIIILSVTKLGLTIHKSSIIWYDFNSPLIVLYSICLFLFIKSSNLKKLSFFVNNISRHSLGIYLIHPFILILVVRFYWYPFEQPFMFLLTAPLLILVFSWLISFLMSKTPIFRFFV